MIAPVLKSQFDFERLVLKEIRDISDILRALLI